MKTKTVTIAGGNPTLLVWDCPLKTRLKTSKKYLVQKKVEQVAFVATMNKLPRLTMMGDELCINSLLAFASTLGNKGLLSANGITKLVKYSNSGYKTTIILDLPFKKQRNIILFEGIGYKIYRNKIKVTKENIKKLTDKYKLPAFGIIMVNENKIQPYIYVKKTNSLIKESACGSGSVAVSLVNKVSKIIQPTGKVILIRKKEADFVISAKVKTISL